MIDHPQRTEDLLSRLEAALPLPVKVTPQLAATLRQRSTKLPTECEIVKVMYSGDEGGIVCQLSPDNQAEAENVVLASITHVDVGFRHPLSKEIRAYQEHRIKKLRRQNRRLSQ